jgi:hypothetical protein
MVNVFPVRDIHVRLLFSVRRGRSNYIQHSSSAIRVRARRGRFLVHRPQEWTEWLHESIACSESRDSLGQDRAAAVAENTSAPLDIPFGCAELLGEAGRSDALCNMLLRLAGRAWPIFYRLGELSARAALTAGKRLSCDLGDHVVPINGDGRFELSTSDNVGQIYPSACLL